MKKVKFFFPDSHDYVDPTFNFETETNNAHRVIQRDDKYAHELFSAPVYDGILVSKAVVDGISGVKGKYSVAQRQRFFREGINRFFRLPKSYDTMGDYYLMQSDTTKAIEFFSKAVEIGNEETSKGSLKKLNKLKKE